MQHILTKLGACALALMLCAAAVPATVPGFAFADDNTGEAIDQTPAVTKQQADIPAAPALAAPSLNGFTVEKCTISAQIQTDASMRVSVQNTLELGENCNTFLWRISSLNGHSITDVNSVRMAHLNDDDKIDGDWITLTSSFFNADLRGALAALNSANASLASNATATLATDQTWMFDSAENMLYAFFPSQTAESAGTSATATTPTTPKIIIDIDYTVKDAVMAYEDVGEMYWYYISGGNNMPIWNLSAVIQLPVPRGEDIEPGETVIAWGHGAPGTVNVQPDGTIRYDAPYVPQDHYMMAHLVFPISWLENMSRETRGLHSGMRKASAIEGEEGWTDTTAALTANYFGVNATCVGICALGIAAALLLYFKRGREHEPSEDELRAIANMSTEQLQQQLSASVSPAVVARFLRHNNMSDADFTESIMHLINADAITVSIDAAPGESGMSGESAVPKESAVPNLSAAARTQAAAHYPHSAVAEKILQERHAPNQLEGVRLHISKGAKSKHLQPIERETLKILFDDIADGYPTLPISDIQRFAEAKPERFTKLMEEWQAQLDEEVAAAGVFDTFGAKLRHGLNIAAALYFVLSIAIGIIFSAPVIVISGIITALVLVAIAAKCRKRTNKGIEFALMDEALQRKQADTAAAAAEPAAPAATATTAAEPVTPASPRFPAEAFTTMLEDEIAKAYK